MATRFEVGDNGTTGMYDILLWDENMHVGTVEFLYSTKTVKYGLGRSDGTDSPCQFDGNCNAFCPRINERAVQNTVVRRRFATLCRPVSIGGNVDFNDWWAIDELTTRTEPCVTQLDRERTRSIGVGLHLMPSNV